MITEQEQFCYRHAGCCRKNLSKECISWLSQRTVHRTVQQYCCCPLLYELKSAHARNGLAAIGGCTYIASNNHWAPFLREIAPMEENRLDNRNSRKGSHKSPSPNNDVKLSLSSFISMSQEPTYTCRELPEDPRIWDEGANVGVDIEIPCLSRRETVDIMGIFHQWTDR